MIKKTDAKSGSLDDDFVLAAVDAYIVQQKTTDPDAASSRSEPGTSATSHLQQMLDSLEMFVESQLASDSPGIGTPIVGTPRNQRSVSRTGPGSGIHPIQPMMEDLSLRPAMSVPQFAQQQELASLGRSNTGSSQFSADSGSKGDSGGTGAFSAGAPAVVGVDGTGSPKRVPSEGSLESLLAAAVPAEVRAASAAAAASRESHADHASAPRPLPVGVFLRSTIDSPQSLHGSLPIDRDASPSVGQPLQFLPPSNGTAAGGDAGARPRPGIKEDRDAVHSFLEQHQRHRESSSPVMTGIAMMPGDGAVSSAASATGAGSGGSVSSAAAGQYDRSTQPASLFATGLVHAPAPAFKQRLTGQYARARAMSTNPMAHTPPISGHPSTGYGRMMPAPSTGSEADAATIAHHLPLHPYHHNTHFFVPVTIVYFAKEMRSVAEELSSGEAAGIVVLREVDWQAFPDGFPNLFIRDVKSVRFNHAMLIASFHTPAQIFQQLAVIYSIPQYGVGSVSMAVLNVRCLDEHERVCRCPAPLAHPAIVVVTSPSLPSSLVITTSLQAKRFTVIVPFFPTGTMERIDEIGQVATAMTLAKMMSVTPHAGGCLECSGVTADSWRSTRGHGSTAIELNSHPPVCPCRPLCAAHGPTQFVIFDIHALSEQHFFSDNVQVRLKSCIPLLHDALMRMPDVDKIVIGFPDEGAAKRFKSKLLGFGDPIVCVKKREGDKRVIQVAEGDPVGKHVVLIDDLVQSGGTLLEAAKAIRARGAVQVSAYCTHAVFPNESWRKFLPGCDGTSPPLKHFWITNSIPTTAAVLQGQAPFEVLSITPIVEDILGV